MADTVPFPRLHARRLLAVCFLSVSLAACGGAIESAYPETDDGATAESGSFLDFFSFGSNTDDKAAAEKQADDKDPESDTQAATAPRGLGVNADLWRAALETISFLPLAGADPMGGAIITDWYNDPGQTDERVKVDIVISGLDLRADAVRVSLFREKRRGNGWVSVATSATAARQLENIVLTKARDYKIARGNQ